MIYEDHGFGWWSVCRLASIHSRCDAGGLVRVGFARNLVICKVQRDSIDDDLVDGFVNPWLVCDFLALSRFSHLNQLSSSEVPSILLYC